MKPSAAMQPGSAVAPRRLLLRAAAAGSLAWLGACSTPLPLRAPSASADPGDAGRLLLASAQAHGLDAYRQVRDVNVRYEGEWRPVVDRLQPQVVDKGFRGRSEERLLPAEGLVAQAYTGVLGTKQVIWRRGSVTVPEPGEIDVWLNGTKSGDAQVRAAAALVAEGYGLFLLGPLWLVDRGLAVERGGSERVDGRPCEVLHVWSRPGLGQVAMDRVTLCIDASSGLTRRLRFTLEGTASTRGAVAQVDTYDHDRRHGIVWPMRSYESVVHPLRLPAHDWRIVGLDIDRGYGRDALLGPVFTGRAAAPAAAL